MVLKLVSKRARFKFFTKLINASSFKFTPLKPINGAWNWHQITSWSISKISRDSEVNNLISLKCTKKLSLKKVLLSCKIYSNFSSSFLAASSSSSSQPGETNSINPSSPAPSMSNYGMYALTSTQYCRYFQKTCSFSNP